MRIQESAENYLETILILQKRHGQVRSIDIASELSFSKPSVSIAMKNLRANELIEMDKNGFITLTDKGRSIAEKIYERHTLLTDWLTNPGHPSRGGGGRRLPDRARDQRGIVSGSQGTCAEKPIPINGRGIPARRQCRAFLRPISPPAVQHPLCPRK